MKLRLIPFLAVGLILSTQFTACNLAERVKQEEVSLESSSKSASQEVYISNSDLKKEVEDVSSVKQGEQLAKRILADKSEIETLMDPFGNKIETRSFAENSRIRLVMVRTPVDGKEQVTVYGYGGETKIVPELTARVLTASADEIADAAKFTARASGPSGSTNFMKNGKSAAALKPLPSSAFQQPVSPVVSQPIEVNSAETTTPPAQPVENED